VWAGLNFVHVRLNDEVVEMKSILFGLELDKGNLDT
jgi:hypothetical protein